MGINGLSKIITHVSDNIVTYHNFKGKRIGVDAYHWLYLSCSPCSLQLFRNHPSQWVVRFMRKVKEVKRAGAFPLLVFDGEDIPTKTETNKSRRLERIKKLDLAEREYSEGNIDRAKALYRQALDITPFFVHHLKPRLIQEEIPFFVAPYEADAQLSYLLKTKYVDQVISGDSDLFTYGCKELLYIGKGDIRHVTIDTISKFLASPSFYKFLEQPNEEYDKPDLSNVKPLTFQQFLWFCILLGCDYSPRLRFLKRANLANLITSCDTHEELFKKLSLLPQVIVSEEFKQRFIKSETTFLYHRVYDPILKKMVTLNPLPDSLLSQKSKLISLLGPELDKKVTEKVAAGIFHPMSLKPFINTPVDFRYPHPHLSYIPPR